MARDYIGHFKFGDHYGPEGLRIDIDAYRQALPDISVSVDDLIAVDDTVIRRFTLRGTHGGPFLGSPPSGIAIELRGIAIDRLTEGQLKESWVLIEEVPRACCLNRG